MKDGNMLGLEQREDTITPWPRDQLLDPASSLAIEEGHWAGTVPIDNLTSLPDFLISW